MACEKENTECNQGKCNPNEICIEGVCINPRTESLNNNGISTKDIKIKHVYPDKILITEVVLNRFPERRQDGTSWDNNNDPDLYITLYQGSDSIWVIPNVLNETMFGSNILIPLSEPIEINNFPKECTISLYEDDGNLIDEFMGGVVFQIYDEQEEHPSELKADKGGTIAISLKLDYIFP